MSDRMPGDAEVRDRRGEPAGETVRPAGPAADKPPAAGTGERSERAPVPPAGRLDAERATWGAQRSSAGDAAEGAPPENVGGAQGSIAEDAVADQPIDEVTEVPGYREPHEGDRRP